LAGWWARTIDTHIPERLRVFLFGQEGFAGGHAVRYREDKPGDLDRARAAVAAWRDQNPAGTAGQLVAAIGGQFHRDYGAVPRSVLFAVDRRQARKITGTTEGTAQ